MQLSVYRISRFFGLLAQRTDEHTRLGSSIAVLQYEAKLRRLNQLRRGAQNKWPQLQQWAEKLRWIASKVTLKRCRTFVKRQQLEFIGKRKALAAFAFRLCNIPQSLDQPTRILKDNISAYRRSLFFHWWTFQRVNNAEKKAAIFLQKQRQLSNCRLLRKVMSGWQCELWRQKYLN